VILVWQFEFPLPSTLSRYVRCQCVRSSRSSETRIRPLGRIGLVRCRAPRRNRLLGDSAYSIGNSATDARSGASPGSALTQKLLRRRTNTRESKHSDWIGLETKSRLRVPRARPLRRSSPPGKR